MESLTEVLSEPLVGTFMGVVGVALAVIFYFKSKQVSRLSLHVDEVAVIGSSTAAFDEQLEIRFGGELVRRVTMTRAIIWNSGNTTIEGNRIVDSDPLRMEIGASNQILKVELVRQSRGVSNVVFRNKGKSAVLINFDFFDPSDGFVVEITHSGTKMNVEWFGTIRGIPKGLNSAFRDPLELLVGRVPRKFVRNAGKSAAIMASIMGLVLAGMGYFAEDVEKADKLLRWPMHDGPGPQWFLVGVGLLYASLPLGMLWMRRRRFPVALDIRAQKLGDDSEQASIS